MISGGVIADQLQRSMATDPWHGPATLDVLRGLAAESAAARPSPFAHSIWEIALHMTAWQREVLARLEGREPSVPQDGDWPEVPAPSDAAWRHACLDLESSLRQLAEFCGRLTPDDLRVPVGASRDRPLGTGVSRGAMLLGLLQHNAYHTGQLALLRKALNS